jgi:hypothetical protein
MGEDLGTPHFEMEMTAAGPQAPSPVLLYLSMDPRCHPVRLSKFEFEFIHEAVALTGILLGGLSTSATGLD